MHRYQLIGHVTHDRLPDGDHTNGGTPIFAAEVVKRLGWTPAVVTAAQADYQRPLTVAAADWHLVPSAQTTTFENQTTSAGRVQYLHGRADSLSPADLPDWSTTADIVHLCPLAQEVDAEMARQFPGALRVATPQGWMRRWEQSSRVFADAWHCADEMLPLLDAVVMSIEDIEGDWSLARRWAKQVETLVVTQDEHGCTLFHHGRKRVFGARLTKNIATTGAGDMFAAAFFVRLHETSDPASAARFANTVASMSLEQPFPHGIPTRSVVESALKRLPSSRRGTATSPAPQQEDVA